MKVLPELLKSVEFGGGGPKVLSATLKIGSKLSADEFNAKLTPVVVRLFGNPDRALRVCLLDNLPSMIDNLPQKVVNDKIFPQMVGQFIRLASVQLTFSRLPVSPMSPQWFVNRPSRLFLPLSISSTIVL
jgi:SCY1-like protein 1